MVKISETICRDDPYDLRRFTKAQKNTYDSALTELKTGRNKPTGYSIYSHRLMDWKTVKFQNAIPLRA